MSLESLEQLPDDVLLIVMQYLSVESLFTCRLVCKRLGALALHPAVWRHRSFSGYHPHPHLAAVLNLAPCLDKVFVNTNRDLAVQMITTRCAVASLSLSYEPTNSRGGTAMELAFVIRNQEALGRLRTLELSMGNKSYEMSYDEERAQDILVKTLAQCSRLVELNITCDILPDTTHPVERGPTRSSLKRFHCILESDSESFVNTILAAHAATLEEVDLRYGRGFEDSTARRLGAMSNLQKLWCVVLPNMEAVAACSALRYFQMPLTGIYDADSAKVLAKFLRRAYQLKTIELDWNDYDDRPEISSILLEGLTAYGQSQVEELVLLGFTDVQPLYSRLNMLPVLRHLNVTEAKLDDALLRSITPTTAPALRLLELGSSGGVCTHAWLHRAAVKTVLALNPSLHIKIKFWGDECDLQGCEACEGDCHQEVTRGKAWSFGLFSHDANKCPCPEYHSTKVWIHFDCTSN